MIFCVCEQNCNYSEIILLSAVALRKQLRNFLAVVQIEKSMLFHLVKVEMHIINPSSHITWSSQFWWNLPFLSKLGLGKSYRVYLILPTLFHPPKPKINEKRRVLPKLIWSRDVTGRVDNMHSNLALFTFAILRCCKSRKKVFIQADGALKIKQFNNLVAKIDTDALIWKIIENKWGWNSAKN